MSQPWSSASCPANQSGCVHSYLGLWTCLLDLETELLGLLRPQQIWSPKICLCPRWGVGGGFLDVQKETEAQEVKTWEGVGYACWATMTSPLLSMVGGEDTKLLGMQCAIKLPIFTSTVSFGYECGGSKFKSIKLCCKHLAH